MMKYYVLILFPCFLSAQQDFKLCDSTNWGTYFAKQYDQERYKVESKLIKEVILKEFTYPRDTNVTGYITIRYFIDCHGKSGKFSVLQVDESYKKTTFNPQVVESILNIVKRLNIHNLRKNFRKGKENELMDYFSFFSFKFKRGEIETILP